MNAVVVTGGTTRLGKVISDFLRSRDWRVITTSHRADARADILADLSQPMGAPKLYSAVLSLLGGEPPFAIVNNAALFTGDAAAINAINFEAPQKLTMLMAGRENGRGAIVNILDSRERDGAYGESKRALRDYTLKSAAMFSDTLNVNAVAPGPVMAPVAVHEQAGDTPLGRPTPEDVAAAVDFLLRAKATTGAIIPVDGGQHLL